MKLVEYIKLHITSTRRTYPGAKWSSLHGNAFFSAWDKEFGLINK